jgi:UTP--glucose-1-phosphate uridylyltransferase
MSTIHKAVIPAAGLGTRFLPATKSQPKEMLPLVDKPTIQYVVEEAVRAGIDDVLVVTGRTKRSLEDHFDRSVELEAVLESSGKQEALDSIQAIAEMANLHYVRQGEPKGLGHAVSLAQQHVSDQPFVVMLGDEIFDPEFNFLLQIVQAAETRGSSVVALMPVPIEKIGSYGCARVEEVDGSDGDLVRIVELVEKPDPAEAPSNLAVVGRYVLDPQIFKALDEVKPGVGGEIQLTDALSLLIDDQPVHGFVVKEGRFDLGNKQDYIRATIEFALRRPDLGPKLREFLADLVRREHIVD